MSIPWIHYSPQGLIVKANAAAAEQYGYSIEELIGKPRSFLIPNSPFDTEMKALLETVIDKHQIHHDVLIIRSADSGSILEQYLPKSLQHSLFNKAPFDNILYRITHDLKSPIRHLSTYAAMIADEKNPDKELIEKWKHFIALSRDKLNTFFDHLINYIGLRADSDYTQDIQLPGISIPFKGNQKQLELALELLKANSIAFKHPERDLKIEVSAEKRGKNIVIGFKDNGVGIDPEDQKRIFEPFEKGKNAPGHPGMGMGLALVKKIAHFHGGDVWVESRPNEGATFYLTIEQP